MRCFILRDARKCALLRGAIAHGPWTAVRERIEKLLPAIDPIGKDVAQPRELHPHLLQQLYRGMAPVFGVPVGSINMNPEMQAFGIPHNGPLTAVDALPCVVAARPAYYSSVDFTVDHAVFGLARAPAFFAPAGQYWASSATDLYARSTRRCNLFTSHTGTHAHALHCSPSAQYTEPPPQHCPIGPARRA